MGGLHLVFSDQRLNYTGFCVFEDLLVQADFLLVQEEDLLRVQEEDLLLVRVGDILDSKRITLGSANARNV